MQISGAVRRSGAVEAERFEGAIEVVAATSAVMAGRRWLETAVVACPRLHAIDGGACLACSRFINVKPSADRSSAMVRCMVVDSDPVSDFMTPAVGLAAVDAESTIEAADRDAREWGVHHLLVTRGDELVGITCRCRLSPAARSSERVTDRMTTDLRAVDERASLGEAVAIMRDAAIGLLPVVRGELVVGLLSRRDLVRVGAACEDGGCSGL